MRKINLIVTAAVIVFLLTEVVANAASVSSVSKDEILKRTNAKNNFAVDLLASSSAMGSLTFEAENRKIKLGSYTLRVEYQPIKIPYFGIIGAGPSMQIHPADNGNYMQNSDLAFAGALGLQARYQMLLFDNQFIVPTASYNMETWRIRERGGRTRDMLTRGYSFGAWIYLSNINKKNSEQLYKDIGISRVYVLAEWTRLEGKKDFSIKGENIFVGLRFEM